MNCWNNILRLSLAAVLALCSGAAGAQGKALIFPIPQQMEETGHWFTLDEQTVILIPRYPSENDLKLARSLVRELSDKYGIALETLHVSVVPDDQRHHIIMGVIDNPLITDYCRAHQIEITAESPGKEGYVLRVEENSVVVAGWDERGAFYGMQSLRQLVREQDGFKIRGVHVRDWPVMPFRGIRLYIPGPENIAFFKRFIRDFMALYKYNKVIIEANYMRLNRHPELNAGWQEFARYMKYTRTGELQGIHGNGKDSGHQDAADGFIMEQDQVKDIVDFARASYIEVIPEIPSLTHGYYLLTRHPELAEAREDNWPDTYCPSNPDTYKLLFDVMDEYIGVMDPKMINVGHDEWWGAPMNVCPMCKGKDYSELFAKDILKLHGYLAKKGIKMAMWGDYLLESVRGKGPQERTTPTGYKYQVPGGLRPEVVRESIPKDILLLNWTWGSQEGEKELRRLGFNQIYGNFKPNISNWDTRIGRSNITGGAPSAWISTNEFTFGKDLVMNFLGCANLLWSTHTIPEIDLAEYVWEQLPVVRRNFRGYNMPSEDGDPVIPVDISSSFNLPLDADQFGVQLTALKHGTLTSGKKIFELATPAGPKEQIAVVAGVQGEGKNPFDRRVHGIRIGEDVSSLIFLHACALPAGNQKSYFNIVNTFDSADLLGWYEVVYDDGYKAIIPIQYGVNILEWNPGGEKSLDPGEGETNSPQKAYCYEGDALACSSDMDNNPVYFFAYEWVNPRFGKKIREINLMGSDHYQATQTVYSHVVTKPLPGNAIVLLGISKVGKRVNVHQSY